MTEQGVVEVQDFMPVLRAHDPDHRQRLVRRVVGLRGSVDLTMRDGAAPRLRPRPSPSLDVDDDVVRFADGDVAPRAVEHRRRSTSTTTPPPRTSRCGTGESALFVLEVLAPGEPARGCSEADVDELFDATARVLARLARAEHLHRPLARVGRPLRADAQAAVPRADRRHRRGADHEPAREHRRRAATGTTATSGSATPPSASTRCCASASPTRRRAFVRFLSERLGEAADDDVDAERLGPLRVLYDLDGAIPARARARPPRAATAARGRCGSATPPSTSSSSTSTASSSTRSTSSTSTAAASATTPGPT